MSQSHLIPFTDMAKQLPHHALTVTILMTPLNAAKYYKVIEYATSFNLSIHFLTLPFPCRETGLHEGCENRDSIQSPDLVPGFFQASNLLQEPLEKWLQELQTNDQRISCIISDICLPWTTDTELKFKIPRIVFHGISCFTLFCSHNLTRYNVLESVTSDSESFSVPEIPDRVEFTKPQLLEGKSQRSPAFKAMLDRFKAAELSAEGVVVNTCEELEQNYIKGYRKTVKNLWCIGPLALNNNYSISNNEHKTLKWLDSKKKNSVLYVCFGSLCHISSNQLKELGMGLEASKHAFIWVIRNNYLSFGSVFLLAFSDLFFW